jgi:hypothetical protein
VAIGYKEALWPSHQRDQVIAVHCFFYARTHAAQLICEICGKLRMDPADPVFVIDSTSGFACHAEASAKAGHSSFWEQLCSQS